VLESKVKRRLWLAVHVQDLLGCYGFGSSTFP